MAGNGIKMSKARLLPTNQVKTIYQLNSNDNGNLVCEFCSVFVSYVSQYVKETANGQTYVGPFLRLHPNQLHTRECKYNVEKEIEKLVADSEKFEDSNQQILFKSSSNKEGIVVNFRLHILLQTFKALSKEMQSNSKNVFLEELERKVYVQNETVLDRYLKTALGVARLRASIEENSENIFKEQIQIVFNKNSIKWKDFYYENKQYLKLFQWCQKGKINYPVALLVTIKRKIFDEFSRKNKYKFQCFASLPNPKNKLVIIPYLYTNNQKISDKILENNTYVIVGEPFAGNISNNKNSNNERFRNIRIILNHPHQITKVSF